MKKFKWYIAMIPFGCAVLALIVAVVFYIIYALITGAEDKQRQPVTRNGLTPTDG